MTPASPAATTDWSQFNRQDETPSAESIPPGEEIMRDAAWRRRVTIALEQREAGHVRPIEEVLHDVDADD